MSKVPLWTRSARPEGWDELSSLLLLLIIGIVLLVIAIAGGAIVHPVLFALGIVALVLFFTGR
jgi:hypothetical protein